MPKALDLTGQKFNRLTAVRKREEKSADGSYFWECVCECGTKKDVCASNLRSGNTKSCGCLSDEVRRIGKHKLSGGKFYSAYFGAKCRCENKNNHKYGGRGIKIEWKSFAEFKDDMHGQYLEHIQKFGIKNTQIDRIDVNGNYCKENCRWATVSQQSNNKRTNVFATVKGEKMTLADIARKYDIKYKTFWKRLHDGWSIEKAIIK